MSHVSQEVPVTAAAGGRGILARVAALLVLLAFALLAFAGWGNATESELVPAAAPTDGKTVEVAISNFTFTPKDLTITPGTTVRVNHDDVPHLVGEKALAFKSQALDTNDSFSFTFTKPGDVEYFCVLHPHMIGKVIVKPGAA